MVVLGTRQEIIKAAPIIDRLRRRKSEFEPIVVTISYAREIFDHLPSLFNITPDLVLNLTHIREGLPSLTSHVPENMTIDLESTRPDLLLTEGDTTPAFAASLAAFNQKSRHKTLGQRLSLSFDTGGRIFPQKSFNRTSVPEFIKTGRPER